MKMYKFAGLALCLVFAPTLLLASLYDSKFDEFDFRDCESLIARLDNFAFSINSYPEATGLIYVYGGKVTQRNEIQMHINIIRSYLIERRDVNAQRLKVLWGGYREKAGADIWIVPPGVSLPSPALTIDQKEVKFKRKPAKESKYGCAKGPWH